MPSTPSAPAQADAHAGYPAPPARTNPGATTTPKPVTPRTDPHAGHASEPQSGKQRDPVNGLMVDPATAPKTTYQGQTYYFSSEDSRKEFLANPAKFARKPKG